MESKLHNCAITRFVCTLLYSQCYLHILVLLYHDFIGKDLVDCDSFCVCASISWNEMEKNLTPKRKLLAGCPYSFDFLLTPRLLVIAFLLCYNAR